MNINIIQKKYKSLQQLLREDNWLTQKIMLSAHNSIWGLLMNSYKNKTTNFRHFNSSDLSSWQDKSPSQKA